MKVHELLSKPGSWCQYCYGVDARGIQQYGDLSGCVEYDLVGAVLRCYGYRDSWAVYKKLCSLLGVKNLVAWNDDPERTREDVVNLCKRSDI